MPETAAAYLVIRRDDGFGDVYPLTPGQRYTLGRAATNPIIIKDDLCSREHAEVSFAEGRWHLRDLKSLNGTRINGGPLNGEWTLSPADEVHLGHTRLVFVENMAQLPDLPFLPSTENVAIKKRLGHTRFLTPLPAVPPSAGDQADGRAETRHELSFDLARLYRLAVDMGAASSYAELVRIVLTGLLDTVPADVGAILTVKDGGELELTEHRHRDSSVPEYVKVSGFVSREVLAHREAILAEDVTQYPSLQEQKSIQEAGASSLICAPILFNERALGLIHLYCTDPQKSLDGEDLEFVLAVARQLGAATHHLQRQASLTNENQQLRDQLRVESEIVGSSPAIKNLENQIARVAGTNATVLIRGESGTGKELVARAIHYTSPRKEGPFVCLNCAALPETLLESELFGHEKGAFTGATEKKIGKFEAADHGTIFLDEIGEMETGLQAKVLRVLDGHPFERLGGHTQISADVRVVAATNQALEKALQAGTFRRDLFYRLQVVEIHLPPLRERQGDVALLANHFLRRFVRETGRRVNGFTPAAVKKMESYHWPGNVRELRNVIERAIALGRGPVFDAPDIWLSSVDTVSAPPPPAPVQLFQPQSLEEIEKQHIVRTLEHTDWNKSQAAGILRIERSTLDRKIKTYELKR
jgi:Nif-specific regulatory protein